ncbi:NAD(P)-dependent oxidoreductase [Pseudactinotalea sp.]|uniref:NAD(P)-dependent oxidoreductase n=1 Tax=Pseudactinotalea sp. TaxID=1926260 RepID=UPI003B3BE715
MSTLHYGAAERVQFEEIFAPAAVIHVRSDDRDGIADALRYVDVAVLAGDLDERYVMAPRLQWVHCDHAGLTRSALPSVFERGLIVSGSAGRSAPALAEHAFFFALALRYRIRTLLDQQARRVWSPPVEYGAEAFALAGQTLGIVGFGHTGRAIARRARAFEMEVIAFRRTIDETTSAEVDLMLSSDAGDDLDPLLERSDIVVLAAGLSDASHHMIGRHQLERMRDSAVLINMGRGGLVDEAALVQALRSGVIAGAGLDVVDTEPLSPESPLWDLPTVLLTPHSTPPVADRTQRSLRVIAENRRRYLAGAPLQNELTRRDVYTR